MSVYGYIIEAATKKSYNSTKEFDTLIAPIFKQFPFIEKEFPKVVSDIENEFYKYYSKQCNESITKKDIKEHLVFKQVNTIKWKNENLISLSIFADLDKDLLKKISDKHIPSITIHFKNQKYSRNEIYFDG